MIVLAIILAILVLLLMLPVGAAARYSADGAQAELLIGPFRLQLYPKTKLPKKRREKTSKPKKAKKAASKKADKPQPEPTAKGGMLPMIWQFVQLGVELLGSLRRKLLVRCLTVRLTYGGDDPAQTAINYGRSVGAAHALVPLLDQIFRIRRQDIRLIYDAQATELTIYVHAAITIRVGQILALAVGYGVRALRIFLASKSNKNVDKAVSK